MKYIKQTGELPAIISGSSSRNTELDKYLPELDEMEIPEVDKIALLETLFDIMRRFVEMGFAPDVCGYVFAEAAALLPDPLESLESSSTNNMSSPESGDEEGDRRCP